MPRHGQPGLSGTARTRRRILPERRTGRGPCAGRAAPRFSFSVWALLAAPSLAMEPAVTDDPDAIGPDGTVRLRCYLPSADTVWFSAGGGHVAPIGIRAMSRLMGPEATVRQLERRLRRCRCGGRRVSVVIQSTPPDKRAECTMKTDMHSEVSADHLGRRLASDNSPPGYRTTMSAQLVALAAAAMCAGFGIYAVSLALRHTEPNPILILAYGLFTASVGLSCWAVW